MGGSIIIKLKNDGCGIKRSVNFDYNDPLADSRSIKNECEIEGDPAWNKPIP